ncbi:hypothetical protein CYMTET_48827 [Cymbomonas tetramitiformis]|uniref:Uncharacterized protein n=1 Tax=Cymbomonas tetramitiformis TaxID=36881 RepID=A0AAE0BRF3_9CHLO|nr:hypothetical protein CYMTET_48827 [Cymbomonas tetramitiformis]
MVSVGGRIDSRYAETKGIPKDDEYRGLVTPAGWAFAIWGIIFMGEIAFTIYQVACTPSEGEQMRWLEALSPWFTAACGFQALWCVAFREWARPVFWLPALMLSGIAAALGGAQAELSQAAVGMTWLQYGLVHAPLSIHFGWVSAAALVNWNSYAALLVHDGVISKPAQMAIASMSIAVAALAGIQVSLVRSDALYGLTIAWALMAVKADGKKQIEKISGSERNGMEDLAVSAQYGAYASVLASCYVVFSDPINSLLATQT